jgi:hypothetical protein
VVALAGCSGDDAGQSAPTTTLAGIDLGGSATGGSPAANVGALPVGTCADITGLQIGQPLYAVAVRPAACEQAHGAESFALVALASGPAAAYPGAAALVDETTDRCVGAFAAYTGSDYVTSALDVAPVIPDEEGWNRVERSAVCLAYDSNLRPLTGSVQNSKR